MALKYPHHPISTFSGLRVGKATSSGVDGYQHRDLWWNMFRSCWNSVITFCRNGHRPLLVNYQWTFAVYSFIISQSHNGVWRKVIFVFFSQKLGSGSGFSQSPPASHHCFRDRFPKKKTYSWWCILGDTEARPGSLALPVAVPVVFHFFPAVRWMSWSPSRKPWCQPGTAIPSLADGAKCGGEATMIGDGSNKSDFCLKILSLVCGMNITMAMASLGGLLTHSHMW